MFLTHRIILRPYRGMCSFTTKCRLRGRQQFNFQHSQEKIAAVNSCLNDIAAYFKEQLLFSNPSESTSLLGKVQGSLSRGGGELDKYLHTPLNIQNNNQKQMEEDIREANGLVSSLTVHTIAIVNTQVKYPKAILQKKV